MIKVIKNHPNAMLHYISTGKVKKAILFEGLLISQKKNPTWKKATQILFLFTNFKTKLAIFSRGLDRINTENSRNNFDLAGPFLEACYKFSVPGIWNCIYFIWMKEWMCGAFPYGVNISSKAKFPTNSCI